MTSRDLAHGANYVFLAPKFNNRLDVDHERVFVMMYRTCFLVENVQKLLVNVEKLTQLGLRVYNICVELRFLRVA